MPSARDTNGIYERHDSPYWWASWIDSVGRPTRRSTGIRRDADPKQVRAKAWRAQQILATTKPEAKVTNPTFDDLMLEYLTQVTPTKRDKERDKWSVKQLYPHFTGRDLATLGVQDARTYIALRKAEGMAVATINKEVGLMSAALNWAKRELEWEVPNPFMARRQKEPAGRNRWLTQDEADRLLKAADQGKATWLADFIRLGLHAGFRPGEILGLEWSRVDLDKALVYLGGVDQKSGKVGSVPLNREARVAMTNRYRFRQQHCPLSPWVFCREDGTRIASIKTGFYTAVERAGLDNVHPHDLRRTCGSWLVQAGVDIYRVSELLRHSDPRITAQVYAHLNPEHLAQAVAALDAPAKLRLVMNPREKPNL